MSVPQKRLASLILKEHYGDIVEKVGLYLVSKGPRNLREIIEHSGFKKEQVQKALCTLIQHHLVIYEQNKKGVTVYNAVLSHILLYLRFPRYTYSAKKLFGDAAELIVEEILLHGSEQMSKSCKKVLTRLKGLGGSYSESDVMLIFADLVNGHFLQRVRPPLQDDVEQAEIFNDEQQFVIPSALQVHGQCTNKRKRSTEDQGKSAKRQRTHSSDSLGTDEGAPDDGIVWHVNFDRFHQYFIDEAIVSAIGKKIDLQSAEIVRTMLKMDSLTRTLATPASKLATLYEVANQLPSIPKLETSQISQYLNLLANDEGGFINKSSDSGGGSYSVNLQKCLTQLCQTAVESVVQERFGSRCFRIFRLLLMKKHLEQKQVGELAMIPSKDTKELLYKLFSESFITLQEIPRAADYAPSRTFYLFSVDLRQLSSMLLERCYQAVGNLMSRRESEVNSHRRLLEKQERLEATVAALQEQHGEEEAAEAVAELQEMVTPTDREQLNKLKATLVKLEQSEIQVDETIFILSSFISCNS